MSALGAPEGTCGFIEPSKRKLALLYSCNTNHSCLVCKFTTGLPKNIFFFFCITISTSLYFIFHSEDFGPPSLEVIIIWKTYNSICDNIRTWLLLVFFMKCLLKNQVLEESFLGRALRMLWVLRHLIVLWLKFILIIQRLYMFLSVCFTKQRFVPFTSISYIYLVYLLTYIYRYNIPQNLW